MLVVRVELWSAITGDKTEIARAVIANDGSGHAKRGNYWAVALRGRDRLQLDNSMRAGLPLQPEKKDEAPGVSRFGEVKDYPRLDLHVWNLVARALKEMGYK